MCWDLFVLQPLMAQENAEGGKQKISKPVDINMRFERVFTHRNFYPLSYRGPQNDGIRGLEWIKAFKSIGKRSTSCTVFL